MHGLMLQRTKSARSTGSAAIKRCEWRPEPRQKAWHASCEMNDKVRNGVDP